jgi:hypothetical protein
MVEEARMSDAVEEHTRPQPTVSSSNLYGSFVQQAEELANRFSGYDGVVGVLLTGGVARGYADHFSELDLAIYLKQCRFEEWTFSGWAPFPEGDSLLDGCHVDIDYMCYEQELKEDWEHIKRWDRSYALILYDPEGLVRDLLTLKAVLGEGEKATLVNRHLVLYGDYLIDLVVPSWVHRGDLFAAHHCLNIALDSLVKAVFLANDELIPFEKWSLNLSYTLEWVPKDWRKWIEQALLVKKVSKEDVDRRRVLLSRLFAECKARLFGPAAEGLAPIEARKLRILDAVRERGSMPATEFDERFGLRMCIQSPFFFLLRREDRDDREWVVFDEARLREHTTRGFEAFLEWDRLLLDELRRD